MKGDRTVPIAFLLIILSIIIILSVTACRQTPTVTPTAELPASPDQTTPIPEPALADSRKIGISMPANNSFIKVGSQMKQMLEMDGYEVDLQYASDDGSEDFEAQSNQQFSQIRSMISGGCKVLVIRAVFIYDEEWANVLAEAKEKDIPVIAYENLIMGSDAVSYYITFDFQARAGKMQGEYIAKALGLPDAKGPFNIETFTDATWYSGVYPPCWGGAMEVLRPYIDSGQINEPSNEWDYWPDGNTAKRMEDLLVFRQYSINSKKLDAILCSIDIFAQEVTQVLLDAGYMPDDFPVITGAGCEIKSVNNIMAGTQSMSVFSDYELLIDKTVEMVKAVFNGEKPEINDTTNYDNSYFSENQNFIPTYLCDMIVVTKDNYREVLIDSGYYTEDELSQLTPDSENT